MVSPPLVTNDAGRQKLPVLLQPRMLGNKVHLPPGSQGCWDTR
ncbi:unnamed protein product, partial [Staurois parvus]